MRQSALALSSAAAAGVPTLAPAARARGQGDAAALAAAGVWPADALHAGGAAVLPSGHALLDAELPGGGWPLGALIELLQPVPTAALWPLLWPALARCVQAPPPARVVLVNPPHEPHAPAFAAAGVPASHLLWLTPGPPATQLWASEQALRCQDVAAVLAWLPQARAAELRRLQQAAARTGALLFVLRPDRHGGDAATPARLRLRVSAAVPAPQRPRLQLVGEGGVPALAPTAAAGPWPQLRIELLKRRGPPRQEPLWLPACGVALGALLRASAQPPVAAIAAVGTGAGARGALRAGGARTVAAPGLPGLHDLSHLPVREGRRALAGAALVVA